MTKVRRPLVQRRGRLSRLVSVLLAALLALALPMTALADDVGEATGTFTYSQNMKPQGYSSRTLPDSGAGSGVFNSDLAFWGDYAFHGHYAGFRIVDVADATNPLEIINWEDCAGPNSTQGNQGDIVVWGDILVRSWNSPAPATGSQCGDWPMSGGEEGVHVIDISDPVDPQVVAFVDTECGSHTATGVPDTANNRLLVYSSASTGTCRGIDIIEVPLNDPAGAAFLRFEPSGDADETARACHDTAVILGDVMKAVCAGGDGLSLWSVGGSDGGSLDDPEFLWSRSFAGVFVGKSASFTWDGRYIVFGHEPGGGSQAQCQATSSDVNRTLFFVDTATGDTAGEFIHPRSQTATENCTWRLFNVVPTSKRYLLVSGNYQSGVSVVDFTDPAAAMEIAFADPAPLSDTSIVLGGDWAAYWYNGLIYESDIRRGLIIWKLTGPARAGAMTFTRLNPQTQETSFELQSAGAGRGSTPGVPPGPPPGVPPGPPSR